MRLPAHVVKALLEKANRSADIADLMGLEGKIRNAYYSGFKCFLREGFALERRVKMPPDNAINCLISFGNSMLYATVLSEIYHTQLNPTISYLHEPSERRFSLSLDLSEVFKPLIVDRTIFALVNNRVIKAKDFVEKMRGCYLNEVGRKKFVQAYDERLKMTVRHKELRRKISYQRLIRLECYALIKHLLGEKQYRGFKVWW